MLRGTAAQVEKPNLILRSDLLLHPHQNLNRSEPGREEYLLIVFLLFDAVVVESFLNQDSRHPSQKVSGHHSFTVNTIGFGFTCHD